MKTFLVRIKFITQFTIASAVLAKLLLVVFTILVSLVLGQPTKQCSTKNSALYWSLLYQK